ncbi:diacylglycerol O-acyltransferase [Herbihabitans rhizosphaerae]|uniref:Diacylglycerol O-acyltransferase n=1 Tax=Herbihabitans rhizosphaerae TaxID=1872711 RepID=A0A4V2EUL2_9PSEU|nr:wax ester/triacylglycerol synthase family O-acyltransferase [Herbihabitans rhizosphaerae]RZS44963.1 diacylglycerol O-acyltransferase [Herbihabitans rhizosphaerae]
MARRLKINDAAWLLAEGKDTPTHVAVLAIFSQPPDAPPTFLRDLVAEWKERRTFAPPFKYKQLGRVVKAWTELADEDVDVDYHLRHSALPAPGGERELGVLISRLHARGLDRNYPLWEAHLIEGLADNRFALYFKVHHSQIDGVGGIRLLQRVLSTDPDARHMAPPWEVGVRGPRPSTLPVAVKDLRPSTKDSLRLASRALGQSARDTVRGPDGPAAALFRAPKAIFNGRIRRPRRFATQSLHLERMRAVAAASGTTVNDVFLAVCSGALRRYLNEVGQLPRPSLTGLVPVSVRPAGDGAVGTAISFIFTRLGTDLTDPADRLRMVHDSTVLAKQRLARLPKSAMDGYTAALMGPSLAQHVAGLGGYGRPTANLVISNVPGPQQPVYLNGARLEHVYPVSLLFHGQALNITAVSYVDQFDVGFTGCRDSLPHMQRLAVYSGDALADLEKATGTI